MSSLIPKRLKLFDTRARKKDFDLSSEQEKTPIVEAETANITYLQNNMVTEQDGTNTNVPNSNHLKENDSINTIDDQNLTFKKNTTSITISKHGSPSIEANYKNTNNETSATNYN
ncbi:1980_t:CDS:2 [Cetraspora pellucida]|uniref:1980_t:CDS:1 n=1 Tax=Cetraspora pellucida TaxID=1433469 RepID=A0A9N9IEA0_9GLOM|nr:1980_t:CDS:2 [Cetraspora pellucida]